VALINSVAFYPCAPVVVVDSTIIGNIVAGGAMGASDATSVEGTVVDTVGITSLEVVSKSLCFD